jgi:hypothetical protein
MGGGPATLGTLTSYMKTGKIHDLLMGKGFAIVEASNSFGGGSLLDYGIRSNTSAKGFIKIICKQNVKAKGDEAIVEKIQESISISKNSGDISNGRSQSYAPNIRKNSRYKNLADSFSNTLQKKMKEMKEEQQCMPKLKQVKPATTAKQLKAKAKSLLKKQSNAPLEPHPIFRDIFQSDLGQFFVDKGEDVIALNTVGHLFNLIGN